MLAAGLGPRLGRGELGYHPEIVGGAIAWSLPPLATRVAAKLFSLFSNVVQGEIPKKRTHNATTQTISLGI